MSEIIVLTERVMWEKIRVVFTIPELRQKILLTLGLLAVYRVGWQVTLPMVDQERMKEVFSSNSSGLGALLSQVAVFSATKLSQATIFGLGIMPYISASIIFQLLGSVWGPLERLQKEGQSGQKKINEYTRYATVVLCLFQSWWYVSLIESEKLISSNFTNASGNMTFYWHFVAVMTMTCGTVFLMWLGEQIDEFGIGNGISLLIMAGILASMPGAFKEMLDKSSLDIGGASGKFGPEKWIVLVILFVGVVAGVVYMTRGQRRIPTQSAKHVRGRRVFGGNRQYLPLMVNQSGVMPIIFASSLLLFPNMLFDYMAKHTGGSFWLHMNEAFTRGTSFSYNFLYIILIFFFCYFWTAITFNPKDMADNLKNFGTFIPGHR
ncbi:MAG TPA: preprotein translocase subunit SecY, partial [Pirellulales bacterium]